MNPNDRTLRGFGLVEALVSLFIFAILLLGLNYSLIISIEHNTATSLRNTATKIAQSYADKLRSDNTTVSTGGENECNPKDGIDKAIDNVPMRNSTIKFETVWNYNILPNTQDKLYNLVVVTCYDYKGLKKFSYQTKIYRGKEGL